MALLLFLLAFLGGPVPCALGEWIDEGGAPTSTFSLLLFAVGVVLAAIGKSAERLVFEVKHRPWLSGRLKRWQRLDPAVRHRHRDHPGHYRSHGGFCILGGSLIGFAHARLVVGAVIMRSGCGAPHGERGSWEEL